MPWPPGLSPTGSGSMRQGTGPDAIGSSGPGGRTFCSLQVFQLLPCPAPRSRGLARVSGVSCSRRKRMSPDTDLSAGPVCKASGLSQTFLILIFNHVSWPQKNRCSVPIDSKDFRELPSTCARYLRPLLRSLLCRRQGDVVSGSIDSPAGWSAATPRAGHFCLRHGTIRVYAPQEGH